MTAGDAIYCIAMVFLAFIYMKITDYQIAQLDKRIQKIEMRIAIAEHKLNIVPHRT
jgi:hypothetical protein